MRTTATLDPDVEVLLRKMMQEQNLTFKEAINKAVRQGFSSQTQASKKFKQKTCALRLRTGIDLTKSLRLAADLEDEAIVQRMACAGK
jgi:hypothetical protein